MSKTIECNTNKIRLFLCHKLSGHNSVRELVCKDLAKSDPIGDRRIVPLIM